jgi:signal transduction histidine kinase
VYALLRQLIEEGRNTGRGLRIRHLEPDELEHSRNRFRTLIRDNGCGTDADVIRSGREGHWGLAGMNERSERIAARLRVLSAPGAGTEIDLVITGQIAFEPGAARA